MQAQKVKKQVKRRSKQFRVRAPKSKTAQTTLVIGNFL